MESKTHGPPHESTPDEQDQGSHIHERKVPTPDEIQREFEEFVKNKFGGSVHVMAVQQKRDEEWEVENIDPLIDPLLDEAEKKEKQTGFNFKFLPKDIKAYLDRFVIKQDEAKKALAVAICDHFNHVRDQMNLGEESIKYNKQNVLLLGPSGVGKTYLIELVADLIGVPFIKADATRFSETGYVGSNVDDLVKDLVAKANGDLEKARFGIIYLDEADKLASSPQSLGRDISGRGVQIGLLKLMEETEVDLKSAHDMLSQLQSVIDFQKKGKIDRKIINTKYILFIISGAFTGLEEIIRRRLQQRKIGLTQPLGKKEKDSAQTLLHEVTTKDLIDFGLEPEFVGRLPIRVSCDNLNAEDLLSILKNSEGSILHQYRRAFKGYGIDVEFDEAALMEISRQASLEKTGARALMTICEKVLREFKYELPSTQIKNLRITQEMIQSPVEFLSKLVQLTSSPLQ